MKHGESISAIKKVYNARLKPKGYQRSFEEQGRKAKDVKKTARGRAEKEKAREEKEKEGQEEDSLFIEGQRHTIIPVDRSHITTNSTSITATELQTALSAKTKTQSCVVSPPDGNSSSSPSSRRSSFAVGTSPPLRPWVDPYDLITTDSLVGSSS